GAVRIDGAAAPFRFSSARDETDRELGEPRERRALGEASIGRDRERAERVVLRIERVEEVALVGRVGVDRARARLRRHAVGGEVPADGWDAGAPATPSTTAYVSIMSVAFSVTTRCLPSGVNWICAGAGLGALSGCVDPSMCERPPVEIRKPETFAGVCASPAL